jgi:hypothetical protein
LHIPYCKNRCTTRRPETAIGIPRVLPLSPEVAVRSLIRSKPTTPPRWCTAPRHCIAIAPRCRASAADFLRHVQRCPAGPHRVSSQSKPTGLRLVKRFLRSRVPCLVSVSCVCVCVCVCAFGRAEFRVTLSAEPGPSLLLWLLLFFVALGVPIGAPMASRGWCPDRCAVARRVARGCPSQRTVAEASPRSPRCHDKARHRATAPQ